MITSHNNGGRRVDLFLPFKHGRKVVKSITLAPVTWDHTLKWQNGDYKSATELLFDLAVQPEVIVRKIRYPDVDRVMNQFFEMLPPEIRDAIAAGSIPQRVEVPVEPVQPEPEVAGEPVAPPEQPKELHEPYRMPTKEEIAADMAAHPPPKDPFGHLKRDETGLGFELSDAR